MSTLVSLKPKLGWVSSELFDDRMDSSFYLSQIELGLDKIFNKKDIKLLTLEDITRRIVDGPFGSAVLANDYVSEGIPFLRVQNVTDYGLNLDDVIFISKECNKRIARSQAVKGNIVFTKTGWLGNTCVLTSEYDVYNIRGDLAVLECKDDVDPYYISTYLNSSFGKKVTSSFGSGSTRPRILLSNIRKIPVPIPSEKIQSYIGNKVRKAEELREEAKRLKEEAEKLLTQFLKLDSLEQKINKVLHLKANYVLPHDMNDRLDSEHYKKKFTILYEHLKELEQSKVKVLSLKKIIEEGSYGILPDSQDYGKGELIFIRSTDLNDYMIDLDSCETVPDKYLTPKATVSPGDILLEIKGAIAGGAIVPDIKTNAIVNGSIFRFRVKNDFNNFYILSVLQSIIGSLQKEQHGANSVISYLSLDVINNLKIPVIDIEKQNEIGDKLKKFVENNMKAKNLIKSAKQDVEDLIEGKFDESKISVGV